MNLLTILEEKIESAGDGSHSPGLKAVLIHVQAAVAHRNRGISSGDDTLFTDTIYRSNQAFEGGLKEGYRVLSLKDPSKKTPNQIEQYLADEGIFRGRVLSQFKNYRTEWRNPSVHDHKLDFDSSEALLAIFSVCAFAIVLLDQILEKLAHDKTAAISGSERDKLLQSLGKDKTDALVYISNLIAYFMDNYEPLSDVIMAPENEYIAALSGFIESIDSNILLSREILQYKTMPLNVDLIADINGDKILIELKVAKFSKNLLKAGIQQLSNYLSSSGFNMPEQKITLGVLVIASDGPFPVHLEKYPVDDGYRVTVVSRNDICN